MVARPSEPVETAKAGVQLVVETGLVSHAQASTWPVAMTMSAAVASAGNGSGVELEAANRGASPN